MGASRVSWWSRLPLAFVVLGLSFALPAAEAAAQTYPRCISGCTANDVRVNSVYLSRVTSCVGGNQTADLYVDLEGNRTYHCVMLVVDVWVNGLLKQQNLTSAVTEDWSGGASSFRVGTITWPCNQSVEIRNIYVQWSPNKGCTSGNCEPYNAPSKCIGNYPNVLVAAGNMPPTAVDDRASASENESVRIDVLANDVDSDGGLNRSTVTIVQAPTSGSTSVDPTMGTVTYVPAHGTCGEDSFHYTVRDDDGAVSGEATVTVAVACNQPPVANDDSATTDENTAIAINVAANDRDPDGVLDPGSIAITQEPGFGSLSVHPGTGIVTYTPAVGGCGDNSFEYTIRDDDGATSDPARVTVSVLCNDPPLAIDDLYNVAEGGALNVPALGVLANDKDTPGRPLSASLISSVQNGTLTLHSDGSFVYVHNGSETRDDAFTYKASDGLKDSNVATVNLVISPTNDAPLAAADEAATQEDVPVSIDVLANDSDPDGDSLSVDVASDPANGRVSNLGNAVQYAPDPNFYGIDTFTYSVSDGHGGTSSAAVTVRVAAVNDDPIAQDDSASTNEDVAVTVSVLANDSDPDGNALTIQSVTQPGNGAVANSATSVAYTPDGNFHGVDTFTYTTSDGLGGVARAVVTVIVVSINDAPEARGGSVSTDEDMALTIFVLANDTDPDGDVLTLESVTQPGHGVVTTSGTTATYTPNKDFHGTDAVTYTVSDGHGGTSSAVLTILVVPVNDGPVAEEDVAPTDEDVAVTIAVLENDADPDGDALTIQSVTQPGNGSVADHGTSVSYVPNRDFHGVDTFTYTVSDGQGGTSSATVTITVAAVNDGPLAQDDAAFTDEDVAVAIPVLANDTDPDGDVLAILSIAQPSHGVVAKSGATVLYTPTKNFHGVDTFTYTASDGQGGTSSATVTITVAAVNDEPLAQDDGASTDEDVAVTVSVLANDSDPDGDPLTIQSVTQPGNGSVVNSGTNVIYTPNDNFQGVDSFTYIADDGHGGMAAALVTIAVATVNDQPVARDDTASTDEEVTVAISVLANDSGPDGDVLAIQSLAQPSHGEVAKSGTMALYTPTKNFHGVDTFAYTVSDGQGGTSSATVTITVAAVNDEPLAQDDHAPTAEDVSVTITVLANDSDPDGDPLAIQSLSSPAHGTVHISGSSVVYAPAPGFSGVDGFTYVVTDGVGGTATAGVTVDVAAVNHPPVARGGSVATDEDAAVTISLLANDTDPDGDALVLQSVTQPSGGSLARSGTSATYTPNRGFHGADAFTYTVSDGRGATATATITITVAAVNHAPLAQSDSASTDEDASVAIPVLANDRDPDGDALTMQSVSPPAHGVAQTSGSTVMYTPAPGFYGVDSFTYVIIDGRGASASALVTVDVANVNDLPIAVGDTVSTLEGAPVTISVLANDTDPDGDLLAIESNSPPLHGATIRAGAVIIYTPAQDYFGGDAFTYTIADGHGGTAAATVTVTVVAVNDLPIAQDDSATTPEDVPVIIAVLSNDLDPDGDELTVQAVAQPVHGVVSNGNGELLYTPDAGFSGTDTFSYTVSDGRGGADTAQVSVTVVHVNRAPIAQDDSAVASGGSMLLIEVLENDSDPDGDFLLIQSMGNAAHGTLLNSRTGISYIPDSGFEGVDTFLYTVSDGSGGVATASVTVSVAAANLAPIARDDSGVTNEDIPVSLAVLLNDLDPDGDLLRVESIAQPAAGSVVRAGASIVYVPATGWSGVDLFTYTVSDGRGGTATASVMVVVVAVNDAPTTQDDSAITDMDVPVSILVLANDSDEDGDVIAILSVSQGLHGMVINQGTAVLYTPDAGFVGTDSFTYTVTDLRGLTTTGTVIVGVAGVAGGGGAASGASGGACDGKVIISEVAWAGSAADAEDEWIELRNLGTGPVDLTGWTLQWRRTRPVAPEDSSWKTVELSGILDASDAAACDAETEGGTPGVLVSTDDPSGLLWRVSYDVDRDVRGYFVLERTREEAVSDVPSDMLYDVARSPMLALSDLGEVIMLVNDRGDVVDTANASSIGRDEWAAGSRSTFGSMERVDPLGPDVGDNWSTNMGIVTRGEDAQKHPLRATPRTLNAPQLETLYRQTGMKPVPLRAGGPLAVSFSLAREARKTTGWPWIITTRPGFDLAAGAGGGLELSTCSFSGRAKAGDEYALDIGTGSATPGVHLFWIVYGKGQALLMPVLITP
jgi:hypothetical protein